MTSNETRDIIFENYCKQIGFSKENSYYHTKKHLKKRAIVASKQKKYLILVMLKTIAKNFQKNKHRKSVKQSEIITYKPQTFKNTNTVDTKSVVTEHPKTSHKLTKTIS